MQVLTVFNESNYKEVWWKIKSNKVWPCQSKSIMVIQL